jgi:hypothetical protein
LVRALRRGRAPSGTEAPGGTSRSTSRGLTGQGPAGFRHPAPPVWRGMRTRRTFRWCRPKAAHDESFAPTRSARTPPVARSGRTRGRVWCNTAAVACRPERVRNERVRYASDDHAAWSLAGSRGPVRPAFAGPRSPAFTEPRGPRAASPAPPRRGSRSAAPEVPSIEEPPGPGIPGFRPVSSVG